MNAWKSITIAGAIFALAAPVANASLDRTLPTKASRANVTKAAAKKVVVVAKTHKPMARVAVNQPLYIYSAGPIAAPSTDVAAVEDDCGTDPAIESQSPAD